MQNFAARLVLGLKKFDHISEGRRSLKWLNVSEKILFNDLVLVFKCLNGLAPGYLADYFITRLAIHGRNLRRSGDLSLPRCRLSAEQRDFYFRGAARWNDLPKDFQGIKDIKVFKKRLANCIFNVVSYYLSDLLF